MTQIVGFVLFLAIVLGAELFMRWRSSRRSTQSSLETTASAALRDARAVARRRVSAASSPPPPPFDDDRDSTPVIALHPRRDRPSPTEYRHARHTHLPRKG